MKEKKNDLSWMFDLDSVGIENPEAAGDLISDRDLDEMQKAYTYKLAFGLFKAACWILGLISIAMLVVYYLTDPLSPALAIFGLITEASAMGLFIVYAAKSSAKGIMREKFSRRMGSKFMIAVYFISGLIYLLIYVDDTNAIWAGIFIAVPYLSMAAVGWFAHINNKVIEKNSEE